MAFATVALSGPALSDASQDALRAIRGLEPPARARLLVSGNTARFIDQKASLRAHGPVVVVLLAGSTFALLFLTGSTLLPLKTLVMNALTLAVTLGVLVGVFQHGWLSGALGYDGPEAIEVTSLAFLFVVIFGLATDYAVLVLARIKEQHDLGVSDVRAIAVVVDATVVRALLVPSLMRLLRAGNWWAPPPLRRLQRRFAVTEG